MVLRFSYSEALWCEVIMTEVEMRQLASTKIGSRSYELIEKGRRSKSEPARESRRVIPMRLIKGGQMSGQ